MTGIEYAMCVQGHILGIAENYRKYINSKASLGDALNWATREMAKLVSPLEYARSITCGWDDWYQHNPEELYAQVSAQFPNCIKSTVYHLFAKDFAAWKRANSKDFK